MGKTTSSTWTLEGELCKVSGEKDINQALLKLGLISSLSASYQLLSNEKDWYRGGAETYLYRFSITESNSKSVDVLIKACVAWSPGKKLNNILRSWIDRRELLEKNKVLAPKLFGWGEGVIIEEYIPFSIKDLLIGRNDLNTIIMEGLVQYAATLSKLGFACISPFSDLRSRGKDVVAVDFGQDLGPPNVKETPSPLMFDLLCDYLKSKDVHITEVEMDIFRSQFASYGGQLFH